VADREQVARAVAQARTRFGDIHGVFHTAGVPGVGLMQLKTPDVAATVLAPKVQGTLALALALDGCALDFMLLCSSITSATGGGLGQVDYCAANAFLDAYARAQARAGGAVVSVSWGEWRWDAWSAGLEGFSEEMRRFFIANRSKYGISFAEGMEAVCRILSWRLPHLFVSNRDLQVMVEESRTFSAAVQAEAREQQRRAQPLHPRPVLGVRYVAPRNACEETIAGIWSMALGLEQIGVDDNFFELGGNSLLGIDLVGRLRKAFPTAQLPIHILYEAPTVSLLGECIERPDDSYSLIDELDDQAEEQRQNAFKYFAPLTEMEDL
jgi:hypothetical protein